MKNKWKTLGDIVKILVGCVLFGIAFNMFLEPNHMNGGGLSGLAMIAVHWIGNPAIGIGTLTMVINIPLFIIGGWKIGKKFFFSSLLGMIALSVAIDATSMLPALQVDPLLAALYGGVLGGLGLGLVFTTGATTGGSDIIVRFLKRRWPNVPIGTINTVFDMMVVALTGIAFQEVSSALYCGICVFIMGQVIDAVVYRFDYSKVALIISKEHEQVAQKISEELGRGATFLDGEGAYSRTGLKVVLTAVKRQQLAELKALVVAVDPDAFIIVQEAHQVLGDGFSRYSKDSL